MEFSKPIGAQFGGLNSRFAVFVAAVFLLCAILVQGVTYVEDEPRQPDESFYLKTAANLHATGVFSTGRARAGESALEDGAPVPDNYSPPLYPAALALLAKVDPGMRAILRCMNGPDPNHARCAPTDRLFGLILLQSVVGALGLLGAFFAFRAVDGRSVFVCTALAVLLATGMQARLATSILPEALNTAALMAFAGAFMTAVRDGRARAWLLAGMFMGLAALLKPSALYLIVLMASVLIWRAPWRRGLALMAVGLAAPVLPWVLRNILVLGEASFTGDYGPVILAQRVAFNMMTPSEWGAAMIYWMPDFGDKLAVALFGADVVERLRFDAPEGFYRIGNSEIMQQFQALALGADAHGVSATSLLIKEWVLSAPFSHLVTTLPIFLRGLWVGDNFGFIAVVLAGPVLFALRGDVRLARLALLAAPFFLLAFFHAGVSINISRYNLGLSVVYAAIWAYVALFGLQLARRILPGRQASRSKAEGAVRNE